MTLKEKRDKVYNYCEDRFSCTGCVLNGKWCDDDYVDTASDDELDEAMKLIGLQPKEHDGCLDCKYDSMRAHEEPCVRCKGTVSPLSDEYNTTPDLWEDDKEETPDETDNVNHPSHYTNGMECIDEMVLIFGVEATMNFCLLNAWKYRKRALHKNGQEDLDKSDWYINKYKELKECIESGR